MWVSLSLFVFWFIMVLLVFEVSMNVGGDRESGGGVVLEAVWTLLPMVVLVFMAYPSLVLLYVGESFSSVGYLFSGSSSVVLSLFYCSGMEKVVHAGGKGGGYRVLDVDNRLSIPAFVGVEVLCTSGDVIHSWAIPAMSIKVDCVPGRLNRIDLEVLGGGVFYGQCSELCGVMHSFMPIVVEVLPMGALLEA
uniref:Cytochrome c oxidase subunit 2 n=1 Tax=Pomphorhynchus rocci TaxID=1183240 RepID=A0A806GMI6_9BILA|nr:cytochrome c oxidase subunit II [Pomphorhynchus rocci]AFJ54218.1 cytochrome c oxidase subunit II [Pomphorhynchus rocci]